MVHQGTIGIPRTPGIGLHPRHIGKGKLTIRQIETIGLQTEQILLSKEDEIAILPMIQELKVVLNAALLSFIMNINVQNILCGQKEDVHVAIWDFILIECARNGFSLPRQILKQKTNKPVRQRYCR